MLKKLTTIWPTWKKNRPDYYAACDKDCSICGVKLCCHFEGRPCEKNKNNLSSLSSEFHTGEILPPPTLPSNPLTAAERELIKKLFLKSGTELIKLENDKLIGYRQGKWSELEINDNSELQLFKRAISQNSSQSLSFADFSSTGSNSSSSHQKLYLGLGLGAGGVLLAGAVVYFWKQKRNRS